MPAVVACVTVSLLTRALSSMAGLPPRRFKALSVERGVRVPMTDGVALLADRYAPSEPPGRSLRT